MRRTLLTIFILVVLLLSFGILFACNSNENNKVEEEEVIIEYTGTPVTKIDYSISGFTAGEYTKTIDFENNNITYSHYDNQWNENRQLIVDTKATFNAGDEKYIIDRFYTYGLFDLEESYTTDEVILDGSNWSLVITFEDGSTKTSGGYAAGPYTVFNKCAFSIYDKTKYEFWSVPEAYKVPPQIDIAQHTDNTHLVTSATLYKYKWRTTTVDKGDLYQFASTLFNHNCDFSTDEGSKNYLTVGTMNNYREYDVNYYEKFSRCVVKEYDYNPELTNEKVLLDTGWIKPKKSKKIDIQKNKIYTIELTFSNDQYSIGVYRT